MNDRIQQLTEWFSGQKEKIIADICQLAAIDSQSGDVQGVTTTVNRVKSWLNDLDIPTLLIPTESGPVLQADFNKGEERILILCHSDTVWPVSAPNKPPLLTEGDILRGPGVLDMKGSIVMVCYAFAAMQKFGPPPAVEYRLVITPDEEIGSPASMEGIYQQAQSAIAAFVPEPAQYTNDEFGAIKRSRKGSSKYLIRIHGREAHAGTNPWDGINAVHLAAPLISAISAENKPDEGQFCNVTMVSGGTAPNAIPAMVEFQVDVRFTKIQAGEAIDSRIQNLVIDHEEARLEVIGGISRPPMVYTREIGDMISLYKNIAGERGIAIEELDTGGGSDGNLTAARGVPTLDGIGLDGGGAHTADEHVNLNTLVDRFVLFTETLLRYGEEL